VQKYSVLTTDREIYGDNERLQSLLGKGVKVIVFCEEGMREQVEDGDEKVDFLKDRLLQVYTVSGDLPELTVMDGQMDEEEEEILEELSSRIPDFNHEQYVIEHAVEDEDIIVEAGAGTGKTTVMVDRIMFLIHTVPDLTLEDIVMITFTNEAARNMKDKIHKTLLGRYRLTRLPKYLKLLEDSSKLRIQTIDSFSTEMISELGSSVGYGKDVKIRGFNHERMQLIYDVLDDLHGGLGTRVTESLGGRVFEVANLIKDFWTKLENIGLTDEEILSLDWGQALDRDSLKLHNTLESSFVELNNRYNGLKLSKDAVSVNDIVKELRRIVDRLDEPAIKSYPIKYMFVDEFQDSDNSQIKTIAWLKKTMGFRLFVVGDEKQSIYRFRGAVATAFDTLRSLMEEQSGEKPKDYFLIKNYRTSEDILNRLDPLFRRWDGKDLINYGKSLSAQNKLEGHFTGHVSINFPDPRRKKAVEVTKRAYEELMEIYGDGEIQDKEKVIAVLARTNNHVRQLSRWFEDEGIPTYNRQEGTFFSCQAVRDFQCMVKAYLYPTSTVNLFDFINSSYVLGSLDMNGLASVQAGSKEQLAFFENILESSNWGDYRRQFRLMPVLSVIRKIVEESKPVEIYVARRKAELSGDGDWDEESINTQLAIEAMQYEANLEKLLDLVRRSFSGEMASLQQIYNYLKVNVATNQKEDEPDISEKIGGGYVHCMTVHKAKGLEFDTVIVPLTHKTYRRDKETEVLIDQESQPIRVGWSSVKWEDWNTASEHRCNNHYRDLTDKEMTDISCEEARLLYVALTRSIRRLEFVKVGNLELTWSKLLEG